MKNGHPTPRLHPALEGPTLAQAGARIQRQDEVISVLKTIIAFLIGGEGEQVRFFPLTDLAKMEAARITKVNPAAARPDKPEGAAPDAPEPAAVPGFVVVVSDKPKPEDQPLLRVVKSL